MAAGDVYRKTEHGAAEIAQRKLKLNPRLRTMLILIDGVQPEFLTKEEGLKIGAPADFLEQLLQLGLVEKVGKATGPGTPRSDGAPIAAPGAGNAFARFREAKNFMNVTIVDAMGIKSFFFTLKLERAGTIDDLRGLAAGYREAIAKSAGEVEAELLAKRLQSLLG